MGPKRPLNPLGTGIPLRRQAERKPQAPDQHATREQHLQPQEQSRQLPPPVEPASPPVTTSASCTRPELSRSGPRRLVPPRCRLVDHRPHASRTGRRRRPDGDLAPATTTRPDHRSLRPRRAVLQLAVRHPPALRGPPGIDGQRRRLLRQLRSRGVLLKPAAKNCSTSTSGPPERNSPSRCSTGSRPSTTPTAATPTTVPSAPSTARPPKRPDPTTHLSVEPGYFHQRRRRLAR